MMIRGDGICLGGGGGGGGSSIIKVKMYIMAMYHKGGCICQIYQPKYNSC